VRAVAALAVAFLASVAMIVTGIPANADAPTQQGWWIAANPGGLPTAPAQPAAPDVPADGLLIEGGPSQTSPTAYAAVIYDVPKGATVGSLTLTVAPNSGTTPATSIQVCPLKTPSIKAEQGGPIADAPAYATQGCVTAGPSADATTYTFNVADLVADGSLALAILPKTPTDRVVLSKPADNSLPVRAAPSTSSDSGSGSFDSSGSGFSGGSFGSSSDTSSSGASFGNTSSLPATGAAVASPAPAARAPSVATPAAQAPAAATPKSASKPFAPASGPPGPASAKPWAVALLIAATVIGAIMWTAAGRAARRAVRVVEQT
jgi:hypothetical protein